MAIIHIVLGKANPERMNGVSKVAHYLATYQKKMGNEVEIWGITPNPEVSCDDRAYTLRQFKAESRPFCLSISLKNAISFLDKDHDIVHLHGGFVPVFRSISKLLKKQQIPYFFSPHGSLSPFALKRGLKKRLYFNLIEKKMLKMSQGIHFLGNWQAEAFRKVLPDHPQIVIPNGQDMNEIRLPQSGGIDSKKEPIFSFCGRLICHYKGLDLLIKAFADYRDFGGKGALWLIGDGSDRKRLETMVTKHKLEDRVVFWGKRFGEEKFGLLDSSDAFVHPSRSEGLPTSVLEAAAVGLPCLVSSPTNMGEAIETKNAGIHIEELKVEAIAAALLQFDKQFQENKHVRMGQRAKALIKSDYSWESIAQNMVTDFYQYSETHAQ